MSSPEQGFQKELQRIASLDAEKFAKVGDLLDETSKWNPSWAKRETKNFGRQTRQLQGHLKQYLMFGPLHHAATTFAAEYQAIVREIMFQRAKYRWAIELIKVCVDLSLIVVGGAAIQGLRRIQAAKNLAQRSANMAKAVEAAHRTRVAASSADAMIGNTAFLAPEIRISPVRRVPPLIISLSKVCCPVFLRNYWIRRWFAHSSGVWVCSASA